MSASAARWKPVTVEVRKPMQIMELLTLPCEKFGDPSVEQREIRLPFSPQTTGSEVTIVSCKLPPHGISEAHVHTDCDEYILFPRDGEVVIDGQTYAVKGNTVVRAQRGESHECRNTSNEVMYLYCVFSPALTPYGRYPQLIEKTNAFLKSHQPERS